MTKKQIKIPIGSGGTRWRTTYTDVPSSGIQIMVRAYEFLRELCVDGAFTGLLNCGPTLFQKLKMEHRDGAWVVELESEEHSGGLT